MKNTQLVELKESSRKQAMLERAEQIVRQGKVSKFARNHWLVQSSSDKTTPGLMYSVLFDETLDCLTCSCPHFEHKLEYCKHILAVAMWFGGKESNA